jgi:opacity protein-like surface antigen
MPSRLSLRAGALAALVATVMFADIAEAQSGRGFLFREPKLVVGARGGFGVARAGSDVFDFTREELTVSESDFNGLSAFGDVGYRMLPRVDLIASVGYAGATVDSESRKYEGTDDLPIRQSTEFRRVPLTAGLRLYPLPRGRRVGSYAWIPAKVVPYVGGAAGGMWYRFRQQGEFVDEETLDIFDDTFSSEGWTPTAEAFGGLEYSVSPRISVTGEGRYAWADAELSSSFEGFDPIDLAGFAVTVGVSLRY